MIILSQLLICKVKQFVLIITKQKHGGWKRIGAKINPVMKAILNVAKKSGGWMGGWGWMGVKAVLKIV